MPSPTQDPYSLSKQSRYYFLGYGENLMSKSLYINDLIPMINLSDFQKESISKLLSDIWEPLITRFQSNFVWFCDEVMSIFREDYLFCFWIFQYSISSLNETEFFVGSTNSFVVFSY